MCINEGSTEEFKNELEGILADYLGVKVAEFKIWSLIIGGSEDDSSPVDPFKETHILFERLIDTVRPV